MSMTHLSLFTGIGGLDLAAEWAGFETVGQCEWADYPTQVLEKHWPDVPRWRDIRTLTKESFYERTGLRTADIISGGFPCQPFSVAGKRRGSEDDRYLWPEMLRVIKEIRPAWVIGENVAGIVNMALDTVLSDLESIGYTTGAFIIPACAVDAPHRRDRCVIVAYAGNIPNSKSTMRKRQRPIKDRQSDGYSDLCNVVPDPDDRCGPSRRQRELSAAEEAGSGGSDYGRGSPEHGARERRAAKPGLGGMADGVSCWMDEPLNIPRIARGVKDRVNRLKCLGNAVVPQQFYPIFRAIAEMEMRLEERPMELKQ